MLTRMFARALEMTPPVTREAHAAGRAAVLLTAAGLMGGVGNLAFNILIARVGGADTYGGVGALLALATVAGFLATGIQYAVARRTASAGGRPLNLLRMSFGAIVPWLLLAACVLVVAQPLAAYLRFASAWPVLLTVLLFGAMLLAAPPTGVAVGLGRFRAIAVTNIAVVVVRVVAGVALSSLSDPQIAALAASLLSVLFGGGALAAVLALGSVPDSRECQETLHTRGVNAEGTVGAAYSAALWGIWTLPVLVARHSLDANTAGRFAAAQLLCGGILFATAPVVMAFYPAVARTGARRVVLLGLGVTLGLSAVALAGLAALGPQVIAWLYGFQFSVSRTLLVTLGVGAASLALATYGLWVTRARQRLQVEVALGFSVAIVAAVALTATAKRSSLALGGSVSIAILGGLAAAAMARAVLSIGGLRQAVVGRWRVVAGPDRWVRDSGGDEP